MQAIEIQSGNLVLAERPVPFPGSGQVLLRVAAAGVNRPDIMQRKGLYPPPVGASDIPGLEVAGTVVAAGENVKIEIGAQVCALLTGGGYAEYCLASAALCLPIPENITSVESAGLPETFFTVWSNIFDRGQLQEGEILLVHGGSSGIGVAAIQFAKAFGATVYITAGTDAKCRFCLELGADAAINYRNQDFVAEVTRLTEGWGVNLILDIIGGEYLSRNIKCLAEEGRLVQIAVQQGHKAEINLLPIMLKRLRLTGSTLRARDDGFKAAIAKKLHENIWPLLITKKIKPVIHAVFPLAEAGKAHELMENSGHFGKIILKVS